MLLDVNIGATKKESKGVPWEPPIRSRKGPIMKGKKDQNTAY